MYDYVFEMGCGLKKKMTRVSNIHVPAFHADDWRVDNNYRTTVNITDFINGVAKAKHESNYKLFYSKQA